ncbi:hypothetical protein [Pleomorphovibrio marinus]|nr:hypothetical protein [Pleomorphovibrio marinus]
MLNYCKLILEKMAFDRRLLIKEYRKSLRWLDSTESQELKAWMRTKIS